MSRVWVSEWPRPQVLRRTAAISATRRMVRADGAVLAALELREMHRVEQVSATALMPAVTPDLLGDALFAPAIPAQRSASPRWSVTR